jgi:toxin secretion/phage lysis holin
MSLNETNLEICIERSPMNAMCFLGTVGDKGGRHEVFMEASRAIFEWLRHQPVITTLIALTVLDVLTGMAAAFVTKKVSSDASLRGMTRKAMVWMIVTVAAAVERLSPDIPLTKLVSGFYCVMEGISILENAGRAGVPIPPVLRDALVKISGTAGTTTQTATVATATVATTVTTTAEPASASDPKGQDQ